MSDDYASLIKRLGTSSVDPDLLAKLNELGKDHKDPLTGLLDYRSFSGRLADALEASSAGALCAIEIDHLQELNLISGWVVGDIAICGLASQMEKTPFPEPLLGRVSGSTFMMFCRERGRGSLRSWHDQVSKSLGQLDIPGVDMFPDGRLTTSAGIFLSDKTPITPEAAMIEAKKRLRFAQKQGGAQLSFLGDANAIDVDESQANITLQVKSSQTTQWSEATIDQLSLTGVSFLASSAFLVRESLSVSIAIKDQSPKEIKASVVWRRPSDSLDPPFWIGVKFDNVDADVAEFLEDALAEGK